MACAWRMPTRPPHVGNPSCTYMLGRTLKRATHLGFLGTRGSAVRLVPPTARLHSCPQSSGPARTDDDPKPGSRGLVEASIFALIELCWRS